MMRFRPRFRIGSQIALLLIAAIVLFNIAASVLFLVLWPRDHFREPPDIQALASVVQVMDAAKPAERLALAQAYSRANPRFKVSLQPDGPPAESLQGGISLPVEAPMAERGPHLPLHGHFRVERLRAGNDTGGGPFRDTLRVSLHDGAKVLVEPKPHAFRGGLGPPWIGPVIASVGFLLFSICLLSLWASRVLTAPLSHFAKAAEDFSFDSNPSPLAEEGPEEVRTAARAFNRMRQRVHGLMADRTRMLAAVSHDLRTPITRMRLRAEFIDDAALRGAMERDLIQMDAMVHAALSFLRGEQAAHRTSPVDLASSLMTIADQFSDMGFTVAYEGPAHLVAQVDQDGLHRAVTNLVQNAVKFGTHAGIHLSQQADGIRIAVVDDGPGIAEADRERMLEPFACGDDARTRTGDAGFGLGLAIAKAIAESHGGSLDLHTVEPHGLEARLTLPLDA